MDVPQRKNPRAERAGEGFQRIRRRENRLTKGSQVVRKGKFPALGNEVNDSAIPTTGKVRKEIMDSVGI